MITHPFVETFINQYKNGEIILNEDRIKLIEWLENDILTRNDIYFDDKQINNFDKFAAKWYFELRNFQKFLSAFIFLKYKEDDSLVFDEFFLYMARGAGKNGFLSALSNYFISELHGIPFYSVSIVANSEKQAQTSFKEVYNVIDMNEPLQAHFIHQKAKIESVATKAELNFHTSNAATKDGGREGVIIYDEVHQYENGEIVDVFSGGLGKVQHPREFFIGTDGFVRDGFIDKLKERSRNILNRDVPLEDDSLFPFLCCIDNEDEMHDSNMWSKANPMFHEPMSEYARGLFSKVKKQYSKLQNDPSAYENFITKRMNLPKVNLEKSVTSWENILRTNQEYDLDELKRKACIGSIDYASVRDFTSCGLFFKYKEKYIIPKELTKTFVCKPFADKHYAYSGVKSEGNNKKETRKFAPIREWEQEGLIEVVKRETMNPIDVVQWFVDRRNEGWNIIKIIGDNFRMEILRPLFEQNGFEVEVIRNPDAASALLAPKIEIAFEEGNIVFGDNPLMRWNINNVLVKLNARGEKTYKKKEEIKRKTDSFMMFLYAMWAARDLPDDSVNDNFESLMSFNF